jgi:hypothetical protein
MAVKDIAVKKYVVRLSAQEREQLEALVRKGKGPARRLLKARILLKADVSEGGPGWSDSKIIEALDTSASRGRQAFSAVGPRSLGKRRRCDSCSRKPLLAFALISIVRSEKTNRTVGKFFLIPDAPLRHLDDAPRNDLAHSTGIGGPGALASRPNQPVPGLIEGRTKHSDSFGIEGCLRPDEVNNTGHPRTPTPQRQACAAGSRRGISFVCCDDSIHCAEMSSSFCLLRRNSYAARPRARPATLRG